MAEEAPLIGDDASVELASNRTSLSLERTRMSADRTLMSTVRTSLSLIGFGFTIHQAFQQLVERGIMAADQTGRSLGIGLLGLGILLLIMGIASHAAFGRQLAARRARLFQGGLLHTDLHYRATPTFIGAVLLLLMGGGTLVAIILGI